MAERHPYTVGGGSLIKTVNHLRKSFPEVVNSDTLKRLGIAPNNESYVINTLRFLGVIDGEGKRTAKAPTVFSNHDDGEFAQAFSQVVKDAYVELFRLHGDGAWRLDQSKLISFFRNADKTSDVVGRRQAVTFETLSALAGQAGEKAKPAPSHKGKAAAVKAKPKPATRVSQPPQAVEVTGGSEDKHSRDFALTVRIEINLPAEADKAHYDMMFRSIRENLINA